jgi:hypothetical protein
MRAIGRDACEHGQGQARQERRSATSRGRWARRTKWNRVSRRGARWCSERQSGDGSRARRDRDEDRPEAGESATARRREEKSGDGAGAEGGVQTRRRQEVVLRRAAGEDGAMSMRVLSCRIRAASAEWAERRRGASRGRGGGRRPRNSRDARYCDGASARGECRAWGEDLPGTRARAVVSVRALIGKS